MDASLLARLNAALAGRYTLERELGRGGMATVWLARDLKHDRPVARAVELNLGARGPADIELVTGDAESRAYAGRLERILATG